MGLLFDGDYFFEGGGMAKYITKNNTISKKIYR